VRRFDGIVLPGQQREMCERSTHFQGCLYACSLSLDNSERCPRAAVAFHPMDVGNPAEFVYLSLVRGDIRVPVQVQEEGRSPGVESVDQTGELNEVLVGQDQVRVHQSSFWREQLPGAHILTADKKLQVSTGGHRTEVFHRWAWLSFDPINRTSMSTVEGGITPLAGRLKVDAHQRIYRAKGAARLK
jgi:hypothetical protein